MMRLLERLIRPWRGLSAPPLQVTPITVHDASNVDIAILRAERTMSSEGVERLREQWNKCVVGTSLEGARLVVIDSGMTVDLVKATKGYVPPVSKDGRCAWHRRLRQENDAICRTGAHGTKTLP